MAGHSGPNIVHNGLILNLDAANTKSFRGEATTNLVNPSWSSWGIDSSGFVTSGIRTILSQYHCRIIDSNSNTRQSIYINGISQNTTYTFSVKFKRITTGPPTLRFQIQYYNSGANIGFVFPTSIELGLITSIDWQTASYTITTPSNTNRILWYMQDGNDYVGYTHEFELKEVQLEAKSYATSFTETSRGTTVATGGGWADRTSNANHGELVNGPTFNAANGGSIVFDGSNDYVSCGVLNLQQNWTLEAMCYMTSDSSFGIFGQGIYSSNQGLHILYQNNSRGMIYGMYANDNDYQNNYRPTTNIWYHWVFTYNHSTYAKQFYADSSLQIAPSSVQNQYLGTGQFNIGAIFSAASSPANGSFAFVKMYNRVLSSQEILQNYNTQKSRFGLS